MLLLFLLEHLQQKISKFVELNASEADTYLVCLCVSCKWEHVKLGDSADHIGELMNPALSYLVFRICGLAVGVETSVVKHKAEHQLSEFF